MESPLSIGQGDLVKENVQLDVGKLANVLPGASAFRWLVRPPGLSLQLRAWPRALSQLSLGLPSCRSHSSGLPASLHGNFPASVSSETRGAALSAVHPTCVLRLTRSRAASLLLCRRCFQSEWRKATQTISASVCRDPWVPRASISGSPPHVTRSELWRLASPGGMRMAPAPQLTPMVAVLGGSAQFPVAHWAEGPGSPLAVNSGLPPCWPPWSLARWTSLHRLQPGKLLQVGKRERQQDGRGSPVERLLDVTPLATPHWVKAGGSSCAHSGEGKRTRARAPGAGGWEPSQKRPAAPPFFQRPQLRRPNQTAAPQSCL